MIYSHLRSRLLASPDLSDALAGRVYRLQAPQGTPRPFVTMQQISRSPLMHLLGDSGTHTARYQVNCIADDPDASAEIATLVRAQLSGWQQADGPRIRAELLLELDTIDHQPGSGTGVARIQQDYELMFDAEAV